DSSRFNGFELVQELLAGRAQHAGKIIGVLQQEGENPLGLLAVLHRDLSILDELQSTPAARENPAAFLKKRGVFQPQRARILERAGRRVTSPQLLEALRLCSQIDRAAKGFDDLSPWQHLRDLSVLLAAKA
ncbi:MAG: DNA polymerase III subunit delta, partial [Marinobacter sp.]|nr:DNA polymerase III subunit delta [Marinobacter sp.]